MSLKYFTDANSAAGYVSLQKENLSQITTIYHLKSSEEQTVHLLLKNLLTAAKKKRLHVEEIYSTFNESYLAGLVIREQSMAFTSGKIVTNGSNIIDLSPLYNSNSLRAQQENIQRLTLNMNQFYKKMYMHFNAALLIHDEWERIYIDRMDFDKADAFRKDTVDLIFKTPIPPKSGDAIVTRRFFGTSTVTGLKDFIPELTVGFKRYFIKGRPGTGKSTLMKDVVTKGVELGYDVDIYHCSLDPKSLDMVVIPELDLCIFDATAPHEYDPIYETDEILDTYVAFVKQDTDERCAHLIASIQAKYEHQIKSARNAMKEGHDLRKSLEQIYAAALQTDAFETLSKELESFL